MGRAQTILIMRILPIIALWLNSTWPCSGQEAGLPKSNANRDMEMVLTVSVEYLQSLVKNQVNYSFPVERKIEGLCIRGHVNATGTTGLEIVPSSSRAEFIISVVGTAVAEFNIQAQPATISATSQIPFTTEKVLRFDGFGYEQAPATAQSSAFTEFTGICSRRRGIIGKAVRKVSSKLANSNRGEINHQVAMAANDYIADMFEEAASELDEKLDELSAFDESAELLREYRPELKEAVFHLAANEAYLLVGLGPSSAAFPKFPMLEESGQVELWIKTRPIEEAMIRMLVDWNGAQDLLRQYVPQNIAKEIPDDVTIASVNGWTVLRLGSLKRQQTEG